MLNMLTYNESNLQFPARSLQFPKHFEPKINHKITTIQNSCDLQRFDSSSSLSDNGKSQESKDNSLCSTPPQKKVQKTAEKRHCQYELKKKTELCKTFQLGLPCPYGDKCSFAHGQEQLLAKKLVPKNYKTAKCKQFCEKDCCHFGPRCQFLHQSNAPSNLTLPTLSYSYLFEGIVNSLSKEGESYLLGNKNKDFIYKKTRQSTNFRRLRVFQLI